MDAGGTHVSTAATFSATGGVPSAQRKIASVVELFHYHLVTSSVREVEARYLAKLGFRLVARYGRIGEDQVHYEAGVSWEELEAAGFRHRLSELERGAVNVVVQPGQWQLPRVDHVGVALDDDEFQEVLERATDLRLRVQEYPGRRTFIATDAGYRLEVHPQRDWIDELLAGSDELRLTELQLRADDPDGKATALAQLLELDARDGEVAVGETTVRFLPSGPRGRPELYGEFFT
jgi:catechol 2,3-dioxygenase-like lactoylglutathione lyase family enzyme